MSDLPKSIRLIEVGPRDGLQIEPKILTADEKVRLINMILDSGFKELEVGAFVHPKAVPSMANSEEVVKRLPERKDVQYRGLWLNEKGLERALATKRLAIDGKLILSTSDAFARRNTNASIEELIGRMPQWIKVYKANGIKVGGLGLQATFGCNYEGDIPLSRVIDLIRQVSELMAANGEQLEHISLADTMGWANPLQIKRTVGAVRERWPDLHIKLHLHDTRGLAIANACAGLEMGVTTFDSSMGGLGGCPFAGHKAAAGNVCTEDLVFMCDEIGVETGIDLEKAVATALVAEELVGHALPGKVMHGGSLGAKRAMLRSIAA